MAKPDFFKTIGITAAAGLTFAGCADQGQPTSTVVPSLPTRKAIETPRPTQTSPTVEAVNITDVQREIDRLANTYPENHPVRRVFTGNLKTLSPIFAEKPSVAPTTPGIFAGVEYGNIQSNAKPRFTVTLYQDRRRVPYPTIDEMTARVTFSSAWKNAPDKVKTLFMEHQAAQIAGYEGFSEISLNIWTAQGRIEKIDPTVSDVEIRRTLGFQSLIENSGFFRAHQGSGYLAVMPHLGQLLQENDPQVVAELNKTELLRIYRQAKESGISVDTIQFGTREFFRTAYDPNGTWVKILTQPPMPPPTQAATY